MTRFQDFNDEELQLIVKGMKPLDEAGDRRAELLRVEAAQERLYRMKPEGNGWYDEFGNRRQTFA